MVVNTTINLSRRTRLEQHLRIKFSKSFRFFRLTVRIWVTGGRFSSELPKLRKNAGETTWGKTFLNKEKTLLKNYSANSSFSILSEKIDRVVKTATLEGFEGKHCLKLCTWFKPSSDFDQKEGLKSTSFLQGCHHCNPRAQRNIFRKNFLPQEFFFVIVFFFEYERVFVFWLKNLVKCLKTTTYMYRAKFLWKINFKNLFFSSISEFERKISDY